jgi:putative transposase
VLNGAAKYKACAELGITIRTYQRWTVTGSIKSDRRPDSIRPVPKNKLSLTERKRLVDTMNSAAFKSLPASQMVPALADEGIYLASESTYYRVLHEEKLQYRRGRGQINDRKVATTHSASGPNELWSWDITWLPGPAKGFHFYLYLILDVFSRKIVGWEIHDEESAARAATLIRRSHLRENIRDKPLVLHSDNGSPMKGDLMLETLYVATSFSRPRVSNDNAYSESIFKTCKYRPDYPYKGFLSITEARDWVLQFSHWYNVNHKHGGLKFVTPHQRHASLAKKVLAKKKDVYQKAKDKNPERWSGQIRNGELVDKVHLNPARDRTEIGGVK